MNTPRHRVLAYRRSRNLGDAMQTYALSRLLPENSVAIYRDRAGLDKTVEPLVVNGWLGLNPGRKKYPATFAGVFIGADDQDNLQWLSTLSAAAVIGTRDPFTQKRLEAAGLPAKMIGCATLTLPRYLGERRGILHIDDGTPNCLTQDIPVDMSWETQWELAKSRIDQLSRAALVYTGRLHITLPCLALGTPVVCQPRGYQLAERFSLLSALNVPTGEAVWKDPAPVAREYIRFLEDALRIPIHPLPEPKLPALIA
jgi:hypothetical protein